PGSISRPLNEIECCDFHSPNHFDTHKPVRHSSSSASPRRRHDQNPRTPIPGQPSARQILYRNSPRRREIFHFPHSEKAAVAAHIPHCREYFAPSRRYVHSPPLDRASHLN